MNMPGRLVSLACAAAFAGCGLVLGIHDLPEGDGGVPDALAPDTGAPDARDAPSGDAASEADAAAPDADATADSPIDAPACDVDTGADPQNCGQCGHGCLGGGCEGGSCQPIRLHMGSGAAGILEMALDPQKGRLLWLLQGFLTGTETCSLPNCGMTSGTFAGSAGANLGAIAAAAGYAYWSDTNASTVYSCATGASPCASATTLAEAGAQSSVYAIAAYGSGAYWMTAAAVNDCNSDGTGCGTLTSVAAPGVLLAASVDGQWVAWVDSTNLVLCQRSACATAQQIVLSPGDAGVFTSIALSAEPTPSLFVTDGSGAVRKCTPPCAGGLATVTLGSTPLSVLADATYVYWIDFDSILRCPVGGCGGTPTTVVPFPTSALELAQDALGLYWGTAQGDIFGIAK